MIIISVCNSCFQRFQVNLQAGEVHLIRQIADENMYTCPCPRLCGGRINLADMPGISDSNVLREPMSITGKELYAAVNGLGLPDEIPKDLLTVEAMLKANPVEEVLLEEHGSRVYLHELVLGNGVTIHLTSGSRGAQVVKMTKERGNGSRDHS